ncbi:hypothetical protein [Candidatus Synechococcus spongiarum]|uniref:Uncharacterized protein n=1 Tax=Candidatus Synechococcus spongiarum TaxID=431041 RepID=A0A171DEW6_9SYNE|nr:hypothetical protein [Candidatus Synechococcus spongiarum]SAY38364.1 hypothetical protein FLM9_222 [Candidatus Synechococcus spongiarum]
MDPRQARQLRDAATPSETTAKDEPTAEDGLLLEFPMQEHHHRIISTFMAEHQRDPSRDGSGTSANRLPVPGVLQTFTIRLKTWWAQRAHHKAPS